MRPPKQTAQIVEQDVIHLTRILRRVRASNRPKRMRDKLDVLLTETITILLQEDSKAVSRAG